MKSGINIDYDKLIEDLHTACVGNQHNIMYEAATAIETLRNDLVCMTPRTDNDKKCKNCKWNNLFWEDSGCSKLNSMEPCTFKPKEVVDGETD